MSIDQTSDATLDFAALQECINYEESQVCVRLTSLTGKTESGVAFNAHVYESVNDNQLALSKLFIISPGESAANNSKVRDCLKQNKDKIIVCEGEVYVGGLQTNIAVVGNPP